MNVLMISSEAVPLVKTGGLADVVTALTDELLETGHDVRIILPRYQEIDITEYESETYPWSLSIDLSGTTYSCRVIHFRMGKAEVLLVDHPLFSSRPGIYGRDSYSPYGDNLLRFTLFSYAVLETVRHLSWFPDIYHCHDWTTGLIPLVLKKQTSRFFRRAVSIMTIHNLGYQGDFSKYDINSCGLAARELFPRESVCYDSRLKMLEVGIEHATWISTVSPTYAREIQTEEFGCSLEGLLQRRADRLTGILNGVDYLQWDPSKDAYLEHRYGVQDVTEGKRANKALLQRSCKLPEDPKIPLIGMVTRITDQKGFRELCSGSPSILERILLELELQLVIVGTGDRQVESYLRSLDEAYDNFSAQIVFNNHIAHLTEAGSDLFLMPSRYEPCGLNQIYSLKYGTLPIVRKTGGLADTVEDISEDLSTGTGIVFSQMAGDAIFDAVLRATRLFDHSPQQIEELRQRAMEKDFSWKESSEHYLSMYTKALQTRGK